MPTSTPTPSPAVLITFEAAAPTRALIAGLLDRDATPVWLTDLDDGARAAALTGADAILARNTGEELRPGEAALIGDARLIQFMTAGVDYIPLSRLPPHVPIACNGGAYAVSMAEHGMAMILAAAKRLLVEHTALTGGTFNQFKRNRLLRGQVCGILGFGGIGVAMAHLARAFGMRVHAINRRGHAEEPTDWIGAPDRLDTLLAASDVLVIATPLSRRTLGLIDARALGLMKPDAILLNLARGEIIDEAALFAHLQAHPGFYACLDAWWVEPVRHGHFRMDHPFLSLPNVIGSPHNSGSSPGNVEGALRQAIDNIKRALTGETPLHLVSEEERML